jgi:hypothetical protein
VAKLRRPSHDRLREFLDWNESNPKKVDAALDEVTLEADSTSILATDAWIDKSSRSSMNLSRLLRGPDAGVFGFMSTRNRWELPAPSTMQTHEPKTNVMPSEGTDLVNWKDAIEFATGSSLRSPTWRASYRCFTGCPSKGIPKVVSLGEETPRSGTRRCKEHRFGLRGA